MTATSVMALNSSVLPSVTAASRQIWSVASSTMAAPSSVLRQRTQSASQTGTNRIQESSLRMSTVTSETPAIEFPGSLRHLPRSFASSMLPRTSQRSMDSRCRFVAMPRGTSNAARSMGRNVFIHAQSRQMSSGFRSRSEQVKPVMGAILAQRRTLFNGGASRNVLGHLEEQANRNTGSATTQYAFYQALMKANMPAIVVERFQSNMFASNNACENLYHRALGSIGQTEGSTVSSITGQSNGSFSHQQIQQAVGQAVAASTRGGNTASSRVQTTGNGAKDSPIYVVVDETIGSTIFKWVKMLLKFCLITYVSFMVISLVVEALQSVKKVQGKTDNEAKPEHQSVRFSDVHGCDEAKDELQELVDFLKNPDKFSTLGGKLPKGVLLVGPPGTGKTLLARAVAGEAGVPFFFMSGSEFDEIYVGVGAKRVRELFAAAKSKSPAIVFIDELDAIGGKRNARDAAYAKQTLNQLLTELDGFDQSSGVIIIAATNFPESLDSALTRPGRFDRNIVVGLPDVRGRMAILKHHMKKIIAGTDVSIESIAAGTPGVSGAELENIVNQAAVHASRAKAKAVSMLDFEWAKDKVMIGAERKSMFITESEKEKTAYHEAGHALVLMFTPGTNPLHKVTILPRGPALGITFHLPEMDKYSKGMDEYEASIDVCMGGKVAESLVFGSNKVTSGVSSDLTHATNIAYAMVTNFGMSEKLGNVDLSANYDNLSAGTRELIESEVRRLIEESRLRVVSLLTTRRKELELLARALVDYETLNREEAFKVVKGEKLEGRMVMPKTKLKIPAGLNTALPEIPGSKPDETPGNSPPAPEGGLTA